MMFGALKKVFGGAPAETPQEEEGLKIKLLTPPFLINAADHTSERCQQRIRDLTAKLEKLAEAKAAGGKVDDALIKETRTSIKVWKARFDLATAADEGED